MIDKEESDESSSKDYVTRIFLDSDFDQMNYVNPIPKLTLNIETPRFDLQSNLN